ncbi:MAG: MoxR family ATPase, partial [Anaerolineae bacterium]|nr:MoxR family ATPase [Anaerolineae bacterium]
LLIDEIDRADDEFESFLLEILSDYQITIPEIGTIRAAEPPVVIITSNRTREVHDALKRRCLYHWIDYPDFDTELRIVRLKQPGIQATLSRQIVAAV